MSTSTSTGLNISIRAWRAIATPLHAIAISCTALRIFHRCRKRQLWWDDFWAFVSVLCDTAYAATPFMRDVEFDSSPSSNYLRIVLFWLTAILFPLVVWTARMSMVMSIARIVPPMTRGRAYLYALAVCFGLMWSALLIQKLWVCCHDTSWHRNYTVQCFLGNTVGILSLCTDILADTCLIAIPWQMLWRVRLPTNQRRLILSLFAASVLSSLAGIVYAVFVFGAQVNHAPAWGRLIGFSANLKAAITLLVCNLLVVVTYIYCLFWKGEDEDVSEPVETRSKSSGPGVAHEPIHPTLTEISDTRQSRQSAPRIYSQRSQYTGPPISNSNSTFA